MCCTEREKINWEILTAIDGFLSLCVLIWWVSSVVIFWLLFLLFFQQYDLSNGIDALKQTAKKALQSQDALLDHNISEFCLCVIYCGVNGVFLVSYDMKRESWKCFFSPVCIFKSRFFHSFRIHLVAVWSKAEISPGQSVAGGHCEHCECEHSGIHAKVC
jgi:hypothetical protein